MIKSIKFENFKALRDTVLPLGRCTILIGPNGSGKSTALQALLALKGPHQFDIRRLISASCRSREKRVARVTIEWGDALENVRTELSWRPVQGSNRSDMQLTNRPLTGPQSDLLNGIADGVRIYTLNADSVAEPVKLEPHAELGPDGAKLAVVLDRLRDQHPERFAGLNEELHRWIPEFDQVLFDTPGEGMRAFVLRTTEGWHRIPAADVSQGTLLALALLTLAYLPEPPPILGLEEPGRGIHPRLLRDVRDAMYRLAYPESFGEDRPPVQVIATTHSPYMVDLFRDHPEEIVIAEKTEDNVEFRRLSDLPNMEEILRDSHLGDAWYSGILGGVPIDR